MARVIRTDEVTLDTDRGPSRLLIAAPGRPRAALLLGHGAGGGVDGFDLAALAAELPALGVAVARYEQPWRTAGKKIAGPPASLDAAWAFALAEARRRWPRVPLFVGGHSAGARVACRCFTPAEAGVVTLSFPLHPPGKPEKSRLGELTAVDGRLLVVQGDRDPFGTASDVRAALEVTVRAVSADPASTVRAVSDRPGPAPAAVVEVPAAGHSLQPGKRSDPDGAARLIVDSVAAFILGE